ncbi:MAG TPA: LLM class F420-dependent oxidoreductase, partial [Dehalococcoidia bacterium]|nr:LLM class F420-dependent oxidoreductase [Dehalococcoidia bacterium]
MKVGNTYRAGWLGEAGPSARKLEELGYDYAGTGEMAHDPMVLATAAALATERVEIGTLAIAFARAPMVLAMGAWDLQQATGGRFALSLGSQVKGHIQRRFGMPWSAPAPRMRDYIRTLHAIWSSFDSGDRPDYVGETYQFTLMNPLFHPGPNGFLRPKVFLAAVGEGMTRV